MNHKLLRIIDANLNRTREGLRVCEDIARFAINGEGIAKSLKFMRHAATDALIDSKNMSLRKLLGERDTANDGLKFFDVEKQGKADIKDIFMSNIERVKESLRVLEECCKIADKDTSRRYRKLRFDAYGIEKTAVEEIEI